MTVQWNEAVIGRLEQEALRRALPSAEKRLQAQARSAVSRIVCPDHGERVRLVSHSHPVGLNLLALRPEGCCVKAKRLGWEAIRAMPYRTIKIPDEPNS
jgi:hypothetical protein